MSAKNYTKSDMTVTTQLTPTYGVEKLLAGNVAIDLGAAGPQGLFTAEEGNNVFVTKVVLRNPDSATGITGPINTVSLGTSGQGYSEHDILTLGQTGAIGGTVEVLTATPIGPSYAYTADVGKYCNKDKLNVNFSSPTASCVSGNYVYIVDTVGGVGEQRITKILISTMVAETQRILSKAAGECDGNQAFCLVTDGTYLYLGGCKGGNIKSLLCSDLSDVGLGAITPAFAPTNMGGGVEGGTFYLYSAFSGNSASIAKHACIAGVPTQTADTFSAPVTHPCGGIGSDGTYIYYIGYHSGGHCAIWKGGCTTGVWGTPQVDTFIGGGSSFTASASNQLVVSGDHIYWYSQSGQHLNIAKTDFTFVLAIQYTVPPPNPPDGYGWYTGCGNDTYAFQAFVLSGGSGDNIPRIQKFSNGTSGGAIQTFSIETPGSGYSVATDLVTTVSPSGGTGATINVDTVNLSAKGTFGSETGAANWGSFDLTGMANEGNYFGLYTPSMTGGSIGLEPEDTLSLIVDNTEPGCTMKADVFGFLVPVAEAPSLPIPYLTCSDGTPISPNVYSIPINTTFNLVPQFEGTPLVSLIYTGPLDEGIEIIAPAGFPNSAQQVNGNGLTEYPVTGGITESTTYTLLVSNNLALPPTPYNSRSVTMIIAS